MGKDIKNILRVLIVSDNQKDYEDLKKYGFEHIDYFQSSVVASNYFSEHQDDAKRYDLVFLGNSKANSLMNGKYKNTFKNILGFDYGHIVEYEEDVYKGKARIQAFGRTFDEFCQFVDYLLEFVVGDKVIDSNYEKYRRLKLEKKDKRSLLKKLNEIRILFYIDSQYVEEMSKYVNELGFANVDFYTYTFGNLNQDEQVLIENMSEYDLVMLPGSNYFGLANELEGQLVYEGNNSTALFYGYKDGYKGGIYRENVSLKIYSVGKECVECDYWYHVAGTGQEINRFKALFNTIVSQYYSIIKKKRKILKNKLELNDVKYYDVLIESYKEEVYLMNFIEDERIIKYDNFEKKVREFIEYQKNNGVVKKTPEIVIREIATGVIITCYSKGHMVGSIQLPNRKTEKPIRLFGLQYSKVLGGKEVLLPCKEVGMYEVEFEKKCDVPRLNDEDYQAFDHMVDRILKVLDDVLSKESAKRGNIYSLKKKCKRKKK